MALDFPASPVNGQAYGSYIYNATVGAWQSKEDPATVAVTSPTAPASANNGDIWYNSNTGVSYVYYADGSSAQWVEIVSSAVPLLDTKADLAGATFTGDVIAPSFSTNSFKRIAMPDGAEYTTQTSSVTGAIKIVLPVGMTNTMVRMTIRVFEYTSNESFDLVVGGYNYSSTSTWVNTSAYILGSPGMNRQFSIRFGYDGSKSVVYVGELSSTWSYPQIYVTDVTIGYSGISLSWLDSWSISFESTAFAGVTSTLSSQQIGYQSSSSTANSLALRDSSANITSNAFISTQATGTAPFTVASTTVVSNLNADMIDGYHESAMLLTRSTGVSTNSTDFNTIVTPGSYGVGGNGNWTGSTNGPTTAYAYGQLVVTVNGNIVTQSYYTHSTGGHFIRTKYNASDWQAWQRISSDYNVTAVGSGGTGSTTAAGARTNLGLEQIKTLYGSFTATSYDSGVGNSGLVWWGEKTVSFGQTFAQIPTISVYCLTTGAVMTATPIQVSTTGFTFRAIRFQATLGTSDFAWSATGRIS